MIPTPLSNALSMTTCVVLVGDRIYSGSTLPTFTELAERIRSASGGPPITDVPLNSGFARIGTWVARRHGRPYLVEQISQAYAGTPLEVHRQIAALHVPAIVTTIFDEYIEAASVPGSSVRTIRSTADLGYVNPSRQYVTHLHGVLSDPVSLRITESELMEPPDLEDFARRLFVTHTPLFLGCDLGDPHLRVRFAQIARGFVGGRALPMAHTPRAYAVGSVVTEAERSFWVEQNLELLDADLGEFLAAALAIPQRSTPTSSVARRRSAPSTTREPFKFLAAFDEDDRAYFFGRDREVADITDAVLAYGFLVLYSRSGLGKTSLLRAGLIPRLRAEGYEALYLRSWRSPIASLREAVRSLLSSADREVFDNEPHTAAALQAVVSRGHRLVFCFDQFEEFFLSPVIADSERADFITLLGTCAQTVIGLSFVLSLREDYLAPLYDIEGQVRATHKHRRRLLALTTEQARDAIVQPFALAGYTITRATSEQILSELDSSGAGVHPAQLQIVCERLYRNAVMEGVHTIDDDSLQSVGGVRTILSSYLAESLTHVPSDLYLTAQDLLKCLVTSHGTRTKLDHAQLRQRMRSRPNDDMLAAVIQMLEEGRLISTETDGGERYVELTHEYLVDAIRQWMTADDLELRRAQELVEQEFHNWRADERVTIGADRYRFIAGQEQQLDLDRDGLFFMLLAALQHADAFEPWLSRLGTIQTDELTRLLEAAQQATGRRRANAATLAAAVGAKLSAANAMSAALELLGTAGTPQSLRLLRELGAPRELRVDAMRRVRERFLSRMVQVPTGQFVMGSDPAEYDWVCRHFEVPRNWILQETPQMTMSVDAFLIDMFSVTNEEYAEYQQGHTYPPTEGKHPATNLSWRDAVAFSAWVGKSLPTECEWERAARGTDGRRFPWGNEFDAQFANCKETGIGQTVPVDSFPDGCSPVGCYNMAGNVFEWTHSADRPYPYDAADGREDASADGYRIMRGGAYSYNFTLARCALRYNYYSPDHVGASLGFRCVIRGTAADYQIGMSEDE